MKFCKLNCCVIYLRGLLSVMSWIFCKCLLFDNVIAKIGLAFWDWLVMWRSHSKKLLNFPTFPSNILPILLINLPDSVSVNLNYWPDLLVNNFGRNDDYLLSVFVDCLPLYHLSWWCYWLLVEYEPVKFMALVIVNEMFYGLRNSSRHIPEAYLRTVSEHDVAFLQK